MVSPEGWAAWKTVEVAMDRLLAAWMAHYLGQL